MNELQTQGYPLLDQINNPSDLRALQDDELVQLAAEVRQFMLSSVSRSGGHLASSLGAVELVIALHRIFDTPADPIVWDVGHQAYAHKILTGRRDEMTTIRTLGGLSGFPCRNESPYDSFGVGHSSTSISAALGMSLAAQQLGESRHCVAVIGDGAMTAGEAFEALNHAGGARANLLVILNDNNMFISENVGALAKHFGKIISGKFYSALRERSRQIFSRMPEGVYDFARRTEEHLKGMVVPGTLFEEMGFTYFGPVDGHDLAGLIRALDNLKELDGPRLLHVVTRKGKGYSPAEDNPIEYHGVGPFDPSQGVSRVKTESLSYTEVFGHWICDMAERDSRIMAITPAMREGSGLVPFSQQFPDRYFDVAIAEQHAVTFAAGLAVQGARPVLAIYSTFLQRGYDQLVHDVALQNLPVVFAVDRAGVVGQDGATHNGMFDLAFARSLPNMTIMAPSDADECYQMLTTAVALNRPVIVRYPRDIAGLLTLSQEEQFTSLENGRAKVVRRGKAVALLVFGTLLSRCLEFAEPDNITLVNMRFVKPLDEELLLELAQNHRLLVTLEDGVIAGGAGSAVAEFLSASGVNCAVRHIGAGDQFIEHGQRDELLQQLGLTSNGIRELVRKFRKQTN